MYNFKCTYTEVIINSKIIHDCTGYDQNEAIMAILMGFSYEKIYGHFTWTKKVAIIRR